MAEPRPRNQRPPPDQKIDLTEEVRSQLHGTYWYCPESYTTKFLCVVGFTKTNKKALVASMEPETTDSDSLGHVERLNLQSNMGNHDHAFVYIRPKTFNNAADVRNQVFIKWKGDYYSWLEDVNKTFRVSFMQ